MTGQATEQVVAIAQGKGGVGKTTTAMNLAAAVAAKGGRVLCVDLDPRYSLTRWLLPDDAAPAASLAELLRGDVDVAGAARATTVQQVSLIASPGDPLEDVEQQLASSDYREEILHDALRDELDPWDLVLLDCPANLGLLTVNALHAADVVIVPVSMQDEGAFNGVTGIQDRLTAVQRRRGGQPTLRALVRTRVQRDAAAYREINDALPDFELPIARTEIPESRFFASAGARRVALVAWRPDVPGAIAYRDLATELLSVDVKAAV
jgi:chromosome partitioning protein